MVGALARFGAKGCPSEGWVPWQHRDADKAKGVWPNKAQRLVRECRVGVCFASAVSGKRVLCAKCWLGGLAVEQPVLGVAEKFVGTQKRRRGVDYDARRGISFTSVTLGFAVCS